MKQKSDASKALSKFLADSSPYGKVRTLRSDKGGEFMAKEFKDILLQHCIKHEQSAPYSPHQNGIADRGWRMLFEMGRCLIIESKLPKQLWSYAIMTAAYIRNRCYQQRTKQTPYNMMTNRKPDISNMHPFGTICYSYVQQKSKLEPRSKQGVFVGYDKESPTYLVYYPYSKKVMRCRCVKFTDSLVIPNQDLDEDSDDFPESNDNTVPADGPYRCTR